MTKNNKLSDKDKQEIRELYAIDRVKFTKYKLAVMYGVAWATVHYVINEPARLKNLELTKQRNQRKREQADGDTEV